MSEAHRASIRLLAWVGPHERDNVGLVAEPLKEIISTLDARLGICTAFLLGHIEQACGFSPVWVRSCGATWLFWLNCMRKISALVAGLGKLLGAGLAGLGN